MDYEKAESFWMDKEKDSVRMEEGELKKRIEAFLASHKTCALATGSGDFVRCTPIEYTYLDGRFYLFSEGGLKFRALKENKNVCLAVYDEYQGFGKTKGLQVTGTAFMVEPWSDEYRRLLSYKKIPEEALKKLPEVMHLIRIMPTRMDFLCSELKKEGYSVRQYLE